jgi:hydantoinase/carbamoylase family amidase
VAFDPERPLADLRELAALTGGPEGAARLAFTAGWAEARRWLEDKLAGLPVDVERDAAGNVWARRAGGRAATLLAGSHLDAVPGGGWLDGALGVCAALELLRAHADAVPPVTVALVDWADEEGARFGRSLFGSSAAAGTLDVAAARAARDADGVTLDEALAEHGLDAARLGDAAGGLAGVAAYLELHIEQGPVLEDRGESVAAVVGTQGVERHVVTFTGRSAHAGSTPLHLRHDAFLAAARLGLAAREQAGRHGGVATVGRVAVSPGAPTIVNGACEITLDQRALDRAGLEAMRAEAEAAARAIAAEEGVAVSFSRLWGIEPVSFDPGLVGLAERACTETAGTGRRMPSGALHDCTEVARQVPAAMLFAPSIGGVSHAAAEDTRDEDLRVALRTFGRWADLVAETLATGAPR